MNPRCVCTSNDALLCELLDGARQRVVFVASVISRPPEHWTSSLGAKPTAAEIRSQLEADLRDAFGTGAALVAEMKVKVLFKGITYQTLKDERFVHLAKAKLPRLRLLEEFQAAPEVEGP